MAEKERMTLTEWVKRTPKGFEREVASLLIERINTLRNELYELTTMLTTMPMPEFVAELMDVEFRVCEVCAAGGDRATKPCKLCKDVGAKDCWCCDTCHERFKQRYSEKGNAL
jgi:hypothetical protein